MIHLDTSFLIRSLVHQSAEDRRLRAWLLAGEGLGMSAVAWAEFLCGPLDQAQAELAEHIVPRRSAFGDSEAVIAAQLFNESGRRRGSLADCMVAATAIRAGATLATANPGDFRKLEATGLRLVDP